MSGIRDMTQYEIYTFILCLLVFALLTGLAVVMLTIITKQSIRLIRHGAEDEQIEKEFKKVKRENKASRVVETIVTALFCVILFAIFAFSTYVNIQDNKYFENIPTMKVVNTGSMAKKHEKNTYLEENGLNDQFQTFDLIFVYKLPAEEDLKLYDIVVYEVDGVYIIHRIVEIEEANEKHPDERWFRLQGDAVETPDRFPVHYGQMRAIYRGQRVAYVGSFIKFMQSPAGWLCILLIVVAMVASPIIDKKLLEERKKRWFVLQTPMAQVQMQAAPRILKPIVMQPIIMQPNSVAYQDGQRTVDTLRQDRPTVGKYPPVTVVDEPPKKK